MIDPRLEQAGWYLRDHSKVKIEIPDQIRFLRAVQSVFLQKRHLETADLYEPPLDMFGADAVERWLTEKEVDELVGFVKTMEIEGKP
jgi:type I site-specific restriction endonuclease